MKTKEQAPENVVRATRALVEAWAIGASECSIARLMIDLSSAAHEVEIANRAPEWETEKANLLRLAS